MRGGIRLVLERAVAVFLIALLLIASGAICVPAVAAASPSIAAFDPCRPAPAPSPQCAQIACKTFAIPQAAAPCARAAGAAPSFRPFVPMIAGRLVRPPLPPPRASML